MYYENAIKYQAEEIKTIREKNIKLKLSEADCQRVSEYCGIHGITLNTLLEGFIGDLVDGTYVNGSDEVLYANNYAERTYGIYPEKTLLYYLLDHSRYMSETDFINTLDDIECLEEILKYAEDNNLKYTPEEEEEKQQDLIDLKKWKCEIERVIDDFKNYTDLKNVDINREIENVRKWVESTQELINQ